MKCLFTNKALLLFALRNGMVFSFLHDFFFFNLNVEDAFYFRNIWLPAGASLRGGGVSWSKSQVRNPTFA